LISQGDVEDEDGGRGSEKGWMNDFWSCAEFFVEMEIKRLLLLVLVLVQATNAGICELMPQAQVDPSASQVQAVEVRDVGMRNGETYAAAYSLYEPPLDRLCPRPTSHLISSHRTRTRIPSLPPSSSTRSLPLLGPPPHDKITQKSTSNPTRLTTLPLISNNQFLILILSSLAPF
jgi:hypothetical protein